MQEQATKIQIDASKDRARLDARSNAQQERLKKAAEAEQRLKQARLDEISSIRARRNRVPSLLLLLASVRPRPAPRALPLSSSSSLLLSLFRPQERELAERALAPPTHAHEVATSILMKQKRVMDLLAKTRKPYRVLISFIVHVWDAGYASTVPARSVARWSNAIHFAVGHLTIACSGCKSKVRSDRFRCVPLLSKRNPR